MDTETFWGPFGDPELEGDGWLGWFLPQPGSAPLVELPDVTSPIVDVDVDFTPIAVALGVVGLSLVAVFAATRR
jgi:hypothetical protein